MPDVIEVQSESLGAGGVSIMSGKLFVFRTTVDVQKIELFVIRNVVWHETHFRSK